MRLDQYITKHCMDLSRSYIQKLIQEERVTINEHIQVKSKTPVQTGDKIEVSLPTPKELNIQPQNIPLDILYEDNDLLIVNKPKGMVVHPAPGHYEDTLVNAILYHCKDNLSGINGVLRPGIVHRIDKDTTGALIVCKNDKAHQKCNGKRQPDGVSRSANAVPKKRDYTAADAAAYTERKDTPLAQQTRVWVRVRKFFFVHVNSSHFIFCFFISLQ